MKTKHIIYSIMIAILISVSGCQLKNEDTLTVGVGQLSGVFNPLYATSVYDLYVSDLVYDSLLTMDKEGNYVPSIAKELPYVSEGGLSITYQLKEDIVFSDGTPLTSEDVAFSINVISDPSYMGALGVRVMNIEGYNEYKNKEANTIKGMNIIDQYTISFTFQKPFRINAEDVGKVPILNSKQFSKYKYDNTSSIEKDTSFIGSGPYMLTSSEVGKDVVLKRNSHYQSDGYRIQNVILKTVDEANDYQALVSGKIDLLAECLQPSKIHKAMNNDDLKCQGYPRLAMGVLNYNSVATPTKDVAVRQALSYAMDRESFIDAYFLKEGNKESLAYIPATYQNPLAGISEETFAKEVNTYPMDMQKAKDLLEQAGWQLNKNNIREKDNQILEINVLAMQNNPYVERMIPIWNKQWHKELGMEVNIEYMDMNSISQIVTQEVNQDKWSVFFMGIYFDGQDPDVIYSMLHSSQAKDYAANISRIQDATLDTLLDEARFEKDKQKMEKKYIEVAKKVNELCVALPMYTNQSYDLYTKRLKHFETTSTYGWTNALYEATIE